MCFTVNGFAQCADPSNIYSFEAGGKSYDVVMEQKTWIDAAACAKELGGYLADILNAEEQTAVFDGIVNGAGVSDTYTEVLNGGGIAYVWIGATDKEVEGKWIWDGDDNKLGLNFWKGQGANGDNDGVAVDEAYSNWGGTGAGTANEPDNFGEGGQDYAAMGLSGWPKGSALLGNTGEWNDIQGSGELYFVVKYDTAEIPVVRIPEYHPSDLQIYPNPAKGVLNIEATDIQQLEIFDLTGRLMGSYIHSPVDVSRFEKGAYLLKVHTPGGILKEKILVE